MSPCVESYWHGRCWTARNFSNWSTSHDYGQIVNFLLTQSIKNFCPTFLISIIYLHIGPTKVEKSRWKSFSASTVCMRVYSSNDRRDITKYDAHRTLLCMAVNYVGSRAFFRRWSFVNETMTSVMKSTQNLNRSARVIITRKQSVNINKFDK